MSHRVVMLLDDRSVVITNAAQSHHHWLLLACLFTGLTVLLLIGSLFGDAVEGILMGVLPAGVIAGVLFALAFSSTGYEPVPETVANGFGLTQNDGLVKAGEKPTYTDSANRMYTDCTISSTRHDETYESRMTCMRDGTRIALTRP